ncbi:MAG: 5-formyltetrahydrofolate cyclo-ligase [Clostridia bacterium]|nr:5-formyltetrahydrofolate cyclo-ligase [Clostridia bacterium]
MQSLTEAKNALRAECKRLRREMPAADKDAADSLIFERTLGLIGSYSPQYLFCYVSSPVLEVDTTRIIDYAIGQGIRVVVPKCVKGTNLLEHFILKDRSDLEKGSFGIMEPSEDKCLKLSGVCEGICIVPGLAFDASGKRLGYGKGYYDRFLAAFSGVRIGLCYESCFREHIPHDHFDAAMDFVITERKIRIINRKRGASANER